MYTINITIQAEDIQDVKQHLSIARDHIATALKQRPDNPLSPIYYDGMKSNHKITIEKKED